MRRPERFVPLLGDLLEIVARFVEAALPQLPDAFAAAARAVHQAGRSITRRRLVMAWRLTLNWR